MRKPMATCRTCQQPNQDVFQTPLMFLFRLFWHFRLGLAESLAMDSDLLCLGLLGAFAEWDNGIVYCFNTWVSFQAIGPNKLTKVYVWESASVMMASYPPEPPPQPSPITATRMPCCAGRSVWPAAEGDSSGELVLALALALALEMALALAHASALALGLLRRVGVGA